MCVCMSVFVFAPCHFCNSVYEGDKCLFVCVCVIQAFLHLESVHCHLHTQPHTHTQTHTHTHPWAMSPTGQSSFLPCHRLASPFCWVGLSQGLERFWLDFALPVTHAHANMVTQAGKEIFCTCCAGPGVRKVCTCTHTYTHTCVHTLTHTRAQTHTHTRTHTHKDKRMYTHT